MASNSKTKLRLYEKIEQGYIPEDNNGPLNEYSPNRPNIRNPGGDLSLYDITGKLKEENDIEDIITRFPSINIKNGGGKKTRRRKTKKNNKKIRKSYRHKK
jgi:hypothetical protein